MPSEEKSRSRDKSKDKQKQATTTSNRASSRDASKDSKNRDASRELPTGVKSSTKTTENGASAKTKSSKQHANGEILTKAVIKSVRKDASEPKKPSKQPTAPVVEEKSNKKDKKSSDEKHSSTKKAKEKPPETKAKSSDLKQEKTAVKTTKSKPDVIPSEKVSVSIPVAPLPKPKPPSPVTAIAETVSEGNACDAAEDDYNYEDDFEDYEDDFEESDDESDDVITDHVTENSATKATDERQQSPEKARKPSNLSDSGTNETEMELSDDDDSEEDLRHHEAVVAKPAAATSKAPVANSSAHGSRPKTSTSLRFDFSHANGGSEIQLANVDRMRRRQFELKQLIELDTVSYCLLDMAPVHDYELYMSSFGKNNRLQVQMQTRDDWLDIDTQTEPIDTTIRWTQHPPTDAHCCGSVSQKQNNFETSIAISDVIAANASVMQTESFRNFLGRYEQLICDLLSENVTSQGMLTLDTSQKLAFSDGGTKLELGYFTGPVVALRLSDVDPNLLLTCHAVTQHKVEEKFDYKGLVCVWTIGLQKEPRYILACDWEPTCCTFGPNSSTTVFAGLRDGSLLVWDLREPSEHHLPFSAGDLLFTLRRPSYDTAYLSLSKAAEAAVVAVQSVPLRSNQQNFPSEENSSENSNSAKSLQHSTNWGGLVLSTYQIASLQETCSVTIWSVIARISAETSEADLGLSPASKVKLVKSTVLTLPPLLLRSLGRRNVHAFAFACAEQNEFYVGTDSGFVLNMSRDNDLANHSAPKLLRPHLEAPSTVTAVEFCPFDNSVLLTACSDGSICVYRTGSAMPLLTLQLDGKGSSGPPAEVVGAKWSPTSPYKFFTLHKCGELATWDLKHNPLSPASIDSVPNCVRLECYTKALDSGRLNAEVHPFMVLASNSGEIQVHRMNVNDAKYTLADGKKLLRVLENI